MDYCLASNQIGNYVSSGGTPSNYQTRNIDCVTLDADTVTCNKLTVDGVEVDTELQDIVAATQHQTASASMTTFTDSVDADQIYCSALLTNNIQGPSGLITLNSPVTCTSTLTSSTSITVNNTTATTGATPLGNFLASAQTSGTSAIYIGKDTTTANNALVLSYNYSSPNYAQISLTGSTAGPKIYSTSVDIPSSLTVKSQIVNPRVIGTLTTTTGAGPFSFAWYTNYTNIYKVVVNFTDVIMASNATNNTPLLSVGYNGNYLVNSAGMYDGACWGNNAASTIPWLTPGGIYLWNVVTHDNTRVKITGSIELTYAGNHTGSQQMWTVKGMLVSSVGAYTYYVNTAGSIFMPATHPTLNCVQMRRYAVDFTSGYMNVLYY
jgi:hypothetical protein